jgi:hypothetical protein
MTTPKSKPLLLSLPALLLAGAAFAATGGEPQASAATGLSAPAPAEAVTAPSPCAGCAGHDCARCPMALAAAAQERPAGEAAAPMIRCGAE